MINVTCAIIRNDEEKVLVVQRAENTDHPLKWEFPGGKVKSGEDLEDCIIREVDEELSLDIIIVDRLAVHEHDYGNKQVRLIPFICDTLADLPVLKEHISYKWVYSDELDGIDFSGADIPVARDYKNRYGKQAGEKTPSSALSQKDRSEIRELLTEKSGFGAIDILAESAIANRDLINLLFEYSLEKDKTLAFRSAYTIQKVSEKDSAALRVYFPRMINNLPSLSNESAIRSYLNMFISVGAADFGEREQGILADCCFKWLNDGKSAIAIKAYSMEILYQLSQIYPELSVELVASIKHNMEDGSAGIVARGQMILNRLQKG